MSNAAPPISSNSPAALRYDDLYEEYQRGLVHTLRGFGPTQSYLSLWVPSEDHEDSLCNMIDAAAAAGETSICVTIGERYTEHIDPDKLAQRLRTFGKSRVERSRDGLTIFVEELHEPEHSTQVLKSVDAQPRKKPIRAIQKANVMSPRIQGIHPYETAMANLGSLARHHRPPPTTTSTDVCLQVSEEKIQFWVLVHKDDRSVRQAGYDGQLSIPQRGALEALCEEVIGRPVIEASQHGAIRAEFRLREHRDLRPVMGIVLPQNSHPVIGLLARLTQKLHLACTEQLQWRDTENEFFPGLSADWIDLESTKKIRAIQDAIDSFQDEHQLHDISMECSEIQFNIRVLVSMEGPISAQRKAEIAFSLEREIRDQVDPRLELYLEELKDRNSIRRLAIVPSSPQSRSTQQQKPPKTSQGKP